ncbi:MAG: AAA family ATPase [Acidobacteriota bacterium]
MQKETGVQEANSPEQGKIIAVVSNKGGVGTTTAATNIATNLARGNRAVCLVDLIFQFGSVTSFLNVEPAYSILDLAKSLRRADPLLLEDALVQHVSGVWVLAEPLHAAAERRIKPAEVDEIFDRLAQFFGFVVIDSPKAFDDMQLLVLDRAEIILFVTEMDLPSLKSARQSFDHFQRMGVDTGKLRVLLNRYIEIDMMDLKAVERILGMRVFWTLPNNYPVVVSAVNQGVPIGACDYTSDIARSYSGLPDALIRSIAVAG